jgi:siroheme synthase-like protein
MSEAEKEHNALFPVFLKLEILNTLIVGGGNVALEKLTAIFNNSPKARVRLIAREINPDVRAYLTEKLIHFEERSFQPGDTDNIDLAIIAINDKIASKEIHDACTARKILTNVADKPDYCDFYLGSIVQKGNLKIAISTNGKSPTIAKRVKDVLNEAFPDEMEDVLNNMEKIRNSLRGDFADKVKQLNDITTVLASKVNSGPPEL